MQWRVAREGHGAVFDLFTNLLELLLSLMRLEPAPFGKIQVRSAVVYMVNDKPGNRRDVCVPGPTSRIRMAILAGTIEDAGYLGRYLHVGLHRLRRIYRGVCSPRPPELCDHEGARQNNHDPFQHLTKHFHIV